MQLIQITPADIQKAIKKPTPGTLGLGEMPNGKWCFKRQSLTM